MNHAAPVAASAPASRDIGRLANPLRLLSLVSVIAWLLVWHGRSTGRFSIEDLLFSTAFVLICLAYGRIFEHITGCLVSNRVGVASSLLTGFFTFNTLFFILTLVSPLGMAGNAAVLAVVALVGVAFAARRKRAVVAPVDELPGLICTLVVGAAATLWVSDLQPIIETRGQFAVFRAWQDVFIHVREISAFAQAHGWTSMSDIKMAGAPAPAYHFASYVSTAAMATFTSTTALAAYGGLLLPLGILLVGIAAFVLVGSFWGVWPAMVAAIAVVALPDAYQQGFGSALLGFHFMSQVNPGMLYGIACMALAWLFMIEGCRRASYRAVAIAYFFLALCLMYKAHLFVANAFLLLIFPCIFFSALRLRWRVLIGIVFVAIFVVTVQISQQLPRVPTIRLDGSGIAAYLRILLDLFDPGIGKQTLRSFFFIQHNSKIVDGIAAAALILLCSFGVWVLIAPLVAWKSRNEVPRDILAFPILVLLNYMVMALGLAIEDHGIGTPEELQNRPMAWAYFVLVSFTVAGGVTLWRNRHKSLSEPARWTLIGLAFLALLGVGLQSTNLQTLRAASAFQSYAAFNSVPFCQVRAAEYVRDHSLVGDLMQDSDGDSRFISTAIAERQSYVSAADFGGKTSAWQDRLRVVNGIQQSGDVAALEAMAKRSHVSWYLLHPADADSWPRDFLDKSVFDCGGYRVIRLAS